MHSIGPSIVKEKADGPDILQKHANGESTGTVKGGFRGVIFYSVE